MVPRRNQKTNNKKSINSGMETKFLTNNLKKLMETTESSTANSKPIKKAPVLLLSNIILVYALNSTISDLKREQEYCLYLIHQEFMYHLHFVSILIRKSILFSRMELLILDQKSSTILKSLSNPTFSWILTDSAKLIKMFLEISLC